MGYCWGRSRLKEAVRLTTEQASEQATGRYSDRVNELPELPRFINIAQAARILGITKTSVYYKIYDQKKFNVVYRVGGGKDAPPDDRPYILLLKVEVEDLAKAEREAAAEVPLRIQINLWNRRVKEWGRQNGWGVVNPKGRPNLDLIEAYVKSHPNDPRPA